MKLDAFHQPMRDMFVENLKALVEGRPAPNDPATIDAILNQCPEVEYCEQCADIFCPYGESLHFHHDGCPCCSFADHDGPELHMHMLARNTGANT